MLFTFTVSAPANTPETAPVKETLRLKSGMITKISVKIPSGHAGLAHLGIFDGETMIMPWGEDQWIQGDDEEIVWEPDYILPSEPAVLEARAWNEDDTYTHEFPIRVWVEPPERRPDWGVIEEGARRLAQFVQRVMGE
jgi:hypothetical protein